MKIAREDLEKYLIEYRKAARALMHYYDQSEVLFELMETSLNNLGCFKRIKNIPVSDEIGEYEEDEYDRPEAITPEAYSSVCEGINDWILQCCSEKDMLARKKSIFMNIYLKLDVFPRLEPHESLSGLIISAYHIKDIKGRVSHKWGELDDHFQVGSLGDNLNSEGEPLQPMKLTNFPDAWSSGKYSGDYAAGLYDMASLPDGQSVMNTVIKGIEELIKNWE